VTGTAAGAARVVVRRENAPIWIQLAILACDHHQFRKFSVQLPLRNALLKYNRDSIYVAGLGNVGS
jgi:hypothetical protein